MKTFNDLEFKEHPAGDEYGITSRIQFDNGYGVSVVTGLYTYGGPDGLYELAVIDSNGEICYTTSITNDVIGYLRHEDVTDVMAKVQQLPKSDNDPRLFEDGFLA